MELKIDDKEFAKELAQIAYNDLYNHIMDDSKDHWYMFYDKDIAEAVQRNVDKLFEENKDRLFNAILRFSLIKTKKKKFQARKLQLKVYFCLVVKFMRQALKWDSLCIT